MLFEDIPVRVVLSRRSTCAIGIDRDGNVTFRGPVGTGEQEIRRILESKRAWIRKKTEEAKRRAAAPREKPLTGEDLEALGKRALETLPPKAAAFAKILGVSYFGITIRCQKTRWGSCSSKGNLNFNCLLMLCPEEIRDYVVVHELCHRKEMNHSSRFWNLVGSVIPDYRRREKWLKENGGAIMRRVFG